MVRPRKSESRKLTNFTVRLSADERARIGRDAEKAALSPSAYVRACALKRTVRVIHESSTIDPSLMLHLLAIGNNLNQIARRMNMEGRIPANLDEVLLNLRELLSRVGKGDGS